MLCSCDLFLVICHCRFIVTGINSCSHIVWGSNWEDHFLLDISITILNALSMSRPTAFFLLKLNSGIFYLQNNFL